MSERLYTHQFLPLTAAVSLLKAHLKQRKSKYVGGQHVRNTMGRRSMPKTPEEVGGY